MKTISIAAGAVLVLATASTVAYAQGSPNVVCPNPQVAASAPQTPQKAGEGESAGKAQNAGEGESAGKAQNAGDGESAGKAQNAGEGESAGKAQNAGEGVSAGKAQNAASVTPCKA
jgi:hypothetical protein